MNILKVRFRTQFFPSYVPAWPTDSYPELRISKDKFEFDEIFILKGQFANFEDRQKLFFKFKSEQ